ncbi:MAG: S9 family peptidase [Pyrinomonadaceae bacterium]
MTSADTLRVASVSDAQISPDGRWVVYNVSTTEGDSTRSTLWLARAVATTTLGNEKQVEPLFLEPTCMNASNARWSPDSRRIAFFGSLSGGGTGIEVVSLDYRHPRLVARLEGTNFFITYAGESLAWSPDGKRLAFINASEDDSNPAITGLTRTNEDPRVIDRIQYKSRTSFSDNKRTHVWFVDVSADAVETFAPQQLTTGPYYDHAISWSPRGNEIAFLSNHERDPDAINNSDIFAVDLRGDVRQITQTRGCEYEPTWSPDGKWIAYMATKRDVTTIDSVAEDTHVWAIEATASNGAGRELTASLDRRTRTPRWSPDSRNIFFLAGDHGSTLLYRVNADGSDADKISPLFNRSPARAPGDDNWTITLSRPFQIGSYTLSNRSPLTFAYTLSDALHPPEVWVGPLSLSVATGGYSLRRIAGQNDALVRSLMLIAPEEIRFKSFDGTEIQGWLMKPVDFRADRRYPLILSIHGGPHGMSGYGFNSTFQVYAARGYSVLYLNPRGSSGYGQKFSDGTLREWGGGDYQDLMRGVDEVLRTHSWIDAERLGVTGGSYGGFMTNWVITQTPRFKAAVSSASVSNLISFYATSLYQDLVHAEFGGFPWDDYDLLWRWSPLRYVKQAQTPTMFIHGEQDNDVHITQAEEMYMALKRRGVDSVLVRYPREGHGLREPRHRIDAMERTLAWFDKYLK